MNVISIDPADKKASTAYLDLPDRLRQPSGRHPFSRSITAGDLSDNHPFYMHSEAAFFLSGTEAEPTGRIAVLDNHNYNAHRNTRHAFFTHFECSDDKDSAIALFDAACQWAKKRGLDTMIGPIGFLQTDARGMRVDGHSGLCSIALPYTPPYYPSLMRAAGMTKRSDYYSGIVTRAYRTDARMEKVAERVSRQTHPKVRNTRSRTRLGKHASRLLDVYETSGHKAQLYYPMTPEEKSLILDRLAKAACPRLIHWMEDEDGAICGVQMAMPNYVEAFRNTRTGLLRNTSVFLRQRRKPDTINISMVFLLPEYQGRGLNLPLNLACRDMAMKIGCKQALVGPIHEDNTLSMNTFRKMGVEFNAVHRLYERNIA